MQFLLFHQIVVQSLRLQQLLVCSLLFELSLVKNDNSISIYNSRKPVRNNNNCTTALLSQSTQRLLYKIFRIVIKTRSCLKKKEKCF